MSSSRMGQAVELLRVFLATQGKDPVQAQLSTLFNLIYADRLGEILIDRDAPDTALQQVADRLGEVVLDHLALETALLGVASAASGRSPEQILDDIAEGGGEASLRYYR